MDFEKLREFLVFYDYLNFTSAAKALNLTQSTLSKHISDLEGEVGVPLIDRRGTTGRNSLTPAGQIFLEKAQGLVADYQAMVDECREAHNGAPFAKIQAVQFDVNIGPQVRAMLDATPHGKQGRQFVYEKNPLDIFEALDAGVIDFAVYYEGTACPPRVDRGTYGCIALKPESLCVMASDDHPLAHRQVTVAEVMGYGTVNLRLSAYRSWYEALEEVFAARGWELRLQLLPESVSRGDGNFYLDRLTLCPCTRRFFEYNENLGVQPLTTLDIVDFSACLHPHLVYQLDNGNPHVRAIAEGARVLGLGE